MFLGDCGGSLFSCNSESLSSHQVHRQACTEELLSAHTGSFKRVLRSRSWGITSITPRYSAMNRSPW